MLPRSARTMAWMLGRCTLTTTSVPSASVARWTCASEAAPSGSRSKEAKRASGGAPSSERTMLSTCSYGKGGTVFWSLSSSVRQAAGRTSARLETIWPTFT